MMPMPTQRQSFVLCACSLAFFFLYYFSASAGNAGSDQGAAARTDQDQLLKVQASSAAASPSAASQIVDCLKNGGGSSCWNEFHRRQFLDVLDAVYALPPEQLHNLKPRDWQVFNLIAPSFECDANRLRRVGADGDGGKWVCGPVKSRQVGRKCIIFSLGCNNQFDFEEAISKFSNNKCAIHTFDCTGQWSNPHTVFHNWCIGGFDGKDEQGRTFKLLSTAAKEVGVEGITLLKMDIEQGEYAVFESFKHEPEAFLPEQVLVELHVDEYEAPFNHDPNNTVKTFIDVIRDIDKLGYSFAVEERNIYCGSCSEFVLIRDRQRQL